MQALTITMLVAVTTFEFLTKGDHWGRWAVFPAGAQYLPEISSLVAAVFVVLAGTRSRFAYVLPKYWLMFGAILVVIGAGAVANSVDVGPMFAGTRIYLRAIPWFFVPAVFAFSNAQIRTQLRVLLIIAVLQALFTVQQRLSLEAEGRFTGDYVSGTLMLSSTVSIFVICGLCILTAMVVRQEIRLSKALVFLLLLVVPMMINETKASLVMLPIGGLLTFFVASERGHRLRGVLVLSGVLAVFAAIYLPVYEYYQRNRPYGAPLETFVSEPERLQSYLSKTNDIGATGEVGRLDSFRVPLRRMAADPVQLLFGFGVGNVSNSALGPKFAGEYASIYSPFLVTSLGRLLMELGLLGTGLVIAVLWQIGRDSLIVSYSRNSLLGALAAGWAGATTVMFLALVYVDVVMHASLSFVFWYLAGLIAATRMRWARSIETGR